MKKIVDKSTGVPLNIVSYTNIEDVYDNDGFGAIPRVYMKKSDYADDVIYTYTQSENTLVGSGSNGKFKATSSGEITSFIIDGQSYAVKQGEETSVNLIIGNWYSFILDTTDNTINFNSGGASNPLNFQIVGGTTRPNNPKENTIWINTSTAIGEYQFSSTEPTKRSNGNSLQTGDVWIKTAEKSVLSINAVKKNAVNIYPVRAYQHSGSEWIYKPAKVYQSGWKDMGLTVYSEGVFSGLYDLNKTGGDGAFQKLSDNIRLAPSGTYGTPSYLYTQVSPAIDFTEYSILEMKIIPNVSFSGTLTNIYDTIVSLYATPNGGSHDWNNPHVRISAGVKDTEITMRLDISTQKGLYIIQPMASSGLTGGVMDIAIKEINLY